MQERAGQLLQNQPAGRRDTAYLLLAAAARLAPLNNGPSAPVKLVAAGGSAVDAFLPVYQEDARAARFRVLQHAIDAAGLRWDEHPEFRARAGQMAITLALRDEAGLAEALAIVDQARLDPQ